MQTPRTEFAQALKAIATERGLDPNVIIETIKQAIIAAYRRDAKERGEIAEDVEDGEEGIEYDVELNSVNGEARIFTWPTEKPEEKKDITPPGFGRIAAQTAKQVIHQKIREAEKGAIMEEFSGRVGSLVSGMVLRFDGPNVRVDMGRTEAIMPVEERIPNETLSPNQRLTFLLKDIIETPRGKEVILSRSDPMFVQKLFAREVPEISSNSVVIKGIAREAGVRTKITVASSQSGVDPVGSCVGQKGVRVQAVTNELNGERVDIVLFSEKDEELIASSLSPAENIEVELNKEEKTAKVKVPEDQLSLAIGRDGQNVRLAAKLTGWRIEVEGLPGTAVKEVVEKSAEGPKDEKTIEIKEKKTKKTKVEELVAEAVAVEETTTEKPEEEVIKETPIEEEKVIEQPEVVVDQPVKEEIKEEVKPDGEK
jgi:N utilization substance protein A